MENTYLECGRIQNTHGVRGGMKIAPMCNTPRDFAALKRVFLKSDGSFTEHRLLKASVSGSIIIATLEGIDTIEAAELLKNRYVYAHRDDFPRSEGEVFLADIVGLDVIDTDTGRIYGKVAEVIESPASYLYRIQTKAGDVLLPAVDEFVKKIDTASGVYIRPIEGFFDEI